MEPHDKEQQSVTIKLESYNVLSIYDP